MPRDWPLTRLISEGPQTIRLNRGTSLALWTNFRQRALDPVITEINRKTDLHIEIESIEREHHRFAAPNFVIKTQAKNSTRSNL